MQIHTAYTQHTWYMNTSPRYAICDQLKSQRAAYAAQSHRHIAASPPIASAALRFGYWLQRRCGGAQTQPQTPQFARCTLPTARSPPSPSRILADCVLTLSCGPQGPAVVVPWFWLVVFRACFPLACANQFWRWADPFEFSVPSDLLFRH
jgi:hypothetical protein